MAERITNYQCPACTGPLRFAGDSGKLVCDYCGSTYDIAEIEAMYDGKNQSAAEAFAETEAELTEDRLESDGDWQQSEDGWGEDGKRLRAYNCPSCGAELICDETTAATRCPYCGNPSIVPGQFTDSFKPDYIIPFKLDKNEAVEALKRYYKGKTLLPKTFATQNNIEDIQGVYVPFWLFSGSVDADVQFHATRSRSHVRGNERITITEHYRLRRAGRVNFEKIPVDASSKMPDAHMDAVEPYDYSELKPFSMAYLPGFMADKYDISTEDCAKRADERAVNSAVSMVSQTASGYDSVVPEAKQVQLHRGSVKYALMPVWLLSTRWNGESYLFAMNGQTGRFIGDLPVSKGRFMAMFAAIAAPLAALLALLMGGGI